MVSYLRICFGTPQKPNLMLIRDVSRIPENTQVGIRWRLVLSAKAWFKLWSTWFKLMIYLVQAYDLLGFWKGFFLQKEAFFMV